MSLMDDMKSKLEKGMEKAKKGLSIAADKTKKGANIAKYQVEIKVEETKLLRHYADLGRHVSELMNNGVYDMSNDAKIKQIMDQIKKADDAIMKYKEEEKKVKSGPSEETPQE